MYNSCVAYFIGVVFLAFYVANVIHYHYSPRIKLSSKTSNVLVRNKTQSALLEAMEETQVTVDGVSYHLPDPFMVMATQNPIEYEGTFPLPEAQLDRFMMNISIGYPNPDDEMNILDSQQHHHPLDDLVQIMSAEELILIQRQVRDIHVHPSIRQY